MTLPTATCAAIPDRRWSLCHVTQPRGRPRRKLAPLHQNPSLGKTPELIIRAAHVQPVLDVILPHAHLAGGSATGSTGFDSTSTTTPAALRRAYPFFSAASKSTRIGPTSAA